MLILIIIFTETTNPGPGSKKIGSNQSGNADIGMQVKVDDTSAFKTINEGISSIHDVFIRRKIVRNINKTKGGVRIGENFQRDSVISESMAGEIKMNVNHRSKMVSGKSSQDRPVDRDL